MRGSATLRHTSDGGGSADSPSHVARMALALGMYARHCREFAAWHRAFIPTGNVSVTLMLDEAATADCAAADATRLTASRLDQATLKLRSSGVRVNWQKTRALFTLLVELQPTATWYVKVDTDTLLNGPSLARVLGRAGAAAEPPQYIGKPMRLFTFRGSRKFVYMQGGAYALSRAAAVAMGGCPRGEWAACPNRFLVDVNNNRTVRERDARGSRTLAETTRPLFPRPCSHPCVARAPGTRRR